MMEFKRRHCLSLCLIMTSLALSQQTVLFRCDFEDKNLCGMKQDTTDSLCSNNKNLLPQCETGTYNWLLVNGETPSSLTGPIGGYQGYYIYMEASFIDPGNFTSIYIPVYLLKNHTGPACVEFAYHMRDHRREAMGTLRLLQGEPGKPATTLWSKSGHQEDAWLLGCVDVTLLGNDQISWKGIRGSDSQSDIALDDITIYAGLCQDVSNSTDVATTSPAHHETSTVGKIDENTSPASKLVTDHDITPTYPHPEIVNDAISDQSVVQNGNNGILGVAVGVSIGLLGVISGIIIAVVVVRKRRMNPSASVKTSTVGAHIDTTLPTESHVYYEILNEDIVHIGSDEEYQSVNPNTAQKPAVTPVNGTINPNTVEKPAVTPVYETINPNTVDKSDDTPVYEPINPNNVEKPAVTPVYETINPNTVEKSDDTPV